MEHVRKAQTSRTPAEPTAERTPNPTTNSLQVERELLRWENQRLRHELERQQRCISELLGDRIEGTDAHSQAIRVQELTDQNDILSRQASETIQQLHQLRHSVETLSADLEAAHKVNRSLMAQINRPTQSGSSSR